MIEPPTAAEIIARLELRPHPEGGFYRETFRDSRTDADGRATLLPDRGPHSVPVMIDIEGDHLVFYTSPRSRKARNLAAYDRLTAGLHEGDLTIIVVPDSGTDELKGISGKLTIKIENGKHFYEFDYSLE